jgi:hypothetical protein
MFRSLFFAGATFFLLSCTVDSLYKNAVGSTSPPTFAINSSNGLPRSVTRNLSNSRGSIWRRTSSWGRPPSPRRRSRSNSLRCGAKRWMNTSTSSESELSVVKGWTRGSTWAQLRTGSSIAHLNPRTSVPPVGYTTRPIVILVIVVAQVSFYIKCGSADGQELAGLTLVQLSAWATRRIHQLQDGRSYGTFANWPLRRCILVLHQECYDLSTETEKRR